jgi:hypothetical protein
MTQYHALGVLYHIKAKDRLAVQKLVSTHVAGHTLRSSYAYCLLIRYASKVGDGCSRCRCPVGRPTDDADPLPNPNVSLPLTVARL